MLQTILAILLAIVIYGGGLWLEAKDHDEDETYTQGFLAGYAAGQEDAALGAHEYKPHRICRSCPFSPSDPDEKNKGGIPHA